MWCTYNYVLIKLFNVFTFFCILLLDKNMLTYDRISWSLRSSDIDPHARSPNFSAILDFRKCLQFRICCINRLRRQEFRDLTRQKYGSKHILSLKDATAPTTTTTTSTSQTRRDVWHSRVCRRRGAAVMTTAYDEVRVCAFKMS